jgi:hypothetical protein
MAAPLTDAEKLHLAQAFYPTRAITKQPNRWTAEAIVTAMTDTDAAATGQSHRAVTKYLQMNQSWVTPHIPARSNDQLMLHIANVWLASQGYQWDKRLEQIGKWKGGHFARPQYSQGQAIIGLFPFIVANMITGPNATPVSEWRWTNMTTIIAITPLDRYCMAIPMMQAIWAVADLDGEMRNVTWRQRYKQQNNLKSWFQHLQKKVQNYGIYDVQWVLTECQNNNTLVPQNMMQGVSVQVGKVL